MHHNSQRSPSRDAAWAGAPILVTGGAGFIGSHLVEHLASLDADVTVLDNLQAGTWENLSRVRDRLNIVEGDVRDAAVVERTVQEVRPRYVFHLAANASVPLSVEDPGCDFEANCAGTFVVLDALRTAGGCMKIVVASSGAVYGEPAAFPIEETAPLAPISPYGASKLCAEIQARMFHTVYGLPVTIARLFNTYGPRMARFVVLDFLRKLQRDPSRLEILGTGQQIRDFTYVSDTVQGLLVLALRGQVGEAYNISSGTSCSVTELANKVTTVLQLEGKTQITYTGSSWAGDAQRWEVSVEKVRGLGYDSKVALEDGLSRTALWFTASVTV